MTDRETHDSDWIADWIARQRDSLAQSTQNAAPDEETEDLARRWAATGQAFFDGLRQFASASGASAAHLDPFNIGDPMLGAWSNASLLQSSLAEQAAEFLGRLPPIGLAREQTEAWRELAQAQAQCKRLEHELRAELVKVQLAALELLEQRLRERDAPQRIDSFRELYDLWVECGEQAYSRLAHSASYSKLQAELGNATMRLRARVQTILEHLLAQFDLPTRSEINSVHRQIRELRQQLDTLSSKRAVPTRRRASVAKRSSSRTAKAARKTAKTVPKARSKERSR